MKGEAGDIGWKHVYLFIWDGADDPAGDGEGIGSASGNAFGQFGDVNFAAANTSVAPGSFNLIDKDLSAFTSASLKVAIVFWAANMDSTGGSRTSYTISDIEFVEVGEAVTVSILEIPNVRAPVAGQTAVKSFTTAQYKGSVEWSPDLPSNGRFVLGTVYTATITLTPYPGYKVDGLAANAFTLKEAATVNVTNVVNTGTLTAIFPAAVQGAADKNVTFTDGQVKGNQNAPTAFVITVDSTTKYSVEGYGSYDQQYTYFPVTFDSGVKLSDYTKISFTVTTVSGSIQYKPIYVLAYAPDAVLPQHIQKDSSVYRFASKTEGNPVAGYGANNLVLDVIVAGGADGDNAQKDANSILVVINLPSDNNDQAKYSISSVKFYND